MENNKLDTLKVNVLGTEYEVNKYKYHDKPAFEKHKINGYCDNILKEIAYVDMSTYPHYEDETEESLRLLEKQTTRHEIVHAFLAESGLCDNSNEFEKGWATNEEMVDWIAIQFPKILKAFQDVECI